LIALGEGIDQKIVKEEPKNEHAVDLRSGSPYKKRGTIVL